MDIEITIADYKNPQHANDLVALLNNYATDIMGGGKPLSDHTRENLIPTLSALPHVFSLLAYVDGTAAGFANCIESFSTFACRKIINIHDIAVLPKFRGQQISQRLLSQIESIATERDCCKLTLEVLEGNRIARNAYGKFGFSSYELDPKAGKALFLEKKLAD
jgi:ribosomal protein S18 acetylase RimI-like enzyme